jgi:hypothetical protein
LVWWRTGVGGVQSHQARAAAAADTAAPSLPAGEFLGSFSVAQKNGTHSYTALLHYRL